MKTIKAVLIILLTISLLFGLFLFYIALLDYKPYEVVILSINNNQVKVVSLMEPKTMTTFNIGYAGLDEAQDFFADGGKKSRAKDLDSVIHNLKGIVSTIDDINPDFLLLQEIDYNSSRSYHGDQIEYFNSKYPNYGYTYGYNYDVPWVPIPIFRPMGMAKSGIATFSKYNATEALRYDLPGKEKWPVQLFELDRCFTETIYKVEDGSDFIVINLHLSAFDKGGNIRQQQLKYLEKHLENAYREGSYIMVGGDWNHNLPGSDPRLFPHDEEWPFWLKNLPDDFVVEGFNWGIDPLEPTVRTLAKSYVKNSNFLAVIDGFLVSDNIEILDVSTTNKQFKNSDHNPVTINFILKK